MSVFVLFQITMRLIAPAVVGWDDAAALVDAVTQDDVADEVLDWLGNAAESLVTIVLIVLGALLILRVLRSSVQRAVGRILENKEQTPRERAQKAQTLASVVESAGRLVVFIIAGMMVLSNLGLDIAPLIASAGVAGLAIGLGAQSLIKDTINGFFILFENQYAVGDAVNIGGSSGSVEEVNLRRTVLRSVNGAAIIIPNGEVRVVENLSKGWARAVIDIDVSPDTDERRVTDVLHAVLDDIQSDPVIGSFIIDKPDILGVNAIDVSGVTFRVLVKTQPLQQWPVERELRRRIWQALREAGVALPAYVGPPVGAAPVVKQP